jgi:NAD(P)-dependent dehydrogenase (short-subunit alcohol dehydrogenase family)
MSDDRALVAVVTGAASGIGRALAEECERRGVQVFRADVTPTPGAALVDVTSRSSVDAFAASVYERVDSVDLLFNNAGIMASAPIVDTTDETWARLLGVNLHGVLNVVGAFVPYLRRQSRRARIVNTASLAGFVPPFGYGNGAYAATKAAVISVSESLEHELADDGIAVSVVCPSGVATGIFGGPDAIPPGLMAPAEAANRILAGVLAGRFYVFTHGDDDTRARIEGRTARIADDFDAAARDVV